MTLTATLLATVLAISPVNAAPPPTYFLGGTDFTGTGTVTEGDIDWLLNGYLSGARNLTYPRSVTGMDASIAVGADAIVDVVDDADGPVRIAGISQGALAIAAAKRALMARPEEDRPGADELVFVAIGDPSSPTGIGGRLPGLHIPIIGVTFRPAPDTPYHTIVVTREYDGLADFPDRPWNLIATLNAVAGILFIHPISYGPDTDLTAIPSADVTETVNSVGGRTTTYFIQNDRLPLLQPLRDLGVDERFVAAIEQPLKQVVDAGYSRNDGGPAVSGNPAPVALAKAEADDPTPAEPVDTTEGKPPRDTASDSVSDSVSRERREERADLSAVKDDQPEDAKEPDTRQPEKNEPEPKKPVRNESEPNKPEPDKPEPNKAAAANDNDNDNDGAANDRDNESGGERAA